MIISLSFFPFLISSETGSYARLVQALVLQLELVGVHLHFHPYVLCVLFEQTTQHTAAAYLAHAFVQPTCPGSFHLGTQQPTFAAACRLSASPSDTLTIGKQ